MAPQKKPEHNISYRKKLSAARTGVPNSFRSKSWVESPLSTPIKAPLLCRCWPGSFLAKLSAPTNGAFNLMKDVIAIAFTESKAILRLIIIH